MAVRSPTDDSPPAVSCPTCGRRVAWTERERWRPFCSERCRLIDLGEWLSEERRIPGGPGAPGDLPNTD